MRDSFCRFDNAKQAFWHEQLMRVEDDRQWNIRLIKEATFNVFRLSYDHHHVNRG